MGAQALDEGSPADLKEGFQFGFDIAPDHLYVQRGLLRYGHNLWPQDLPGFEAHSRLYYEAVRALSHRLLGVIALSLEMPEDFFAPVLKTPIATSACCTIRRSLTAPSTTRSVPVPIPTGAWSPSSRRTTSADWKSAMPMANG
jgi:hypothetical protein